MRSFLDPDLFLMTNSICASAFHSCLEHQFMILSPEKGMQGRGLGLNKRRQGDRRKGQASIGGGGKAERAGSFRWLEEDGGGGCQACPAGQQLPSHQKNPLQDLGGGVNPEVDPRSNSLFPDAHYTKPSAVF